MDIEQLEYDNLYDTLFDLLEKSTLKKRVNRHYTNRRGFPDYRGGIFGLVRPRIRYKGYKELSHDSKRLPKVYEEIMRIGNIICPFEFTSIQLNKNLVCPKHKDSNNVGVSLLVSFGDYKGGQINIDNKKYDARCRPIIFDGSKLEHYNDDIIEGTKYSLVYFK